MNGNQIILFGGLGVLIVLLAYVTFFASPSREKAGPKDKSNSD